MFVFVVFQLYYAKLPADVSKRTVLLMDPMCATGGSVCRAVTVLKQHGVEEDKIVFATLMAASPGIDKVLGEFPNIRIVCGSYVQTLNPKP